MGHMQDRYKIHSKTYANNLNRFIAASETVKWSWNLKLDLIDYFKLNFELNHAFEFDCLRMLMIISIPSIRKM